MKTITQMTMTTTLALALLVGLITPARAENPTTTYRGEIGDISLELTVDFSSGSPMVVAARGSNELESGDLMTANGPYFTIGVGAYGEVSGEILRHEQGAATLELDIEFFDKQFTLQSVRE